MVNKYFIISSIVILMVSCSYHLSLDKKPYNGSQLRIDGFYYSVGVDSMIHTGYFFYEDGTLSNRGGRYHPRTIKEQFRKDIKSEKHIKYARESRFTGGLFQIEGNVIKFEKWYPSSGGLHKCYVREGIILNDTTFVIKASYRLVNGKKKEFGEEDELYHFMHYTPKPDSINVFIK
jgi:hypothetical protein